MERGRRPHQLANNRMVELAPGDAWQSGHQLHTLEGDWL